MKIENQKKRSPFFPKIWQTTAIGLIIIGCVHTIIKKYKPLSSVDNFQEHGFTVRSIASNQLQTKQQSSNLFGRLHNCVPIKSVLVGMFFVGLVAVLSQSAVQKYGSWFKANLLSPEQIIFDGTSMPIKEVPNWSILSEAERKMSYNQLPRSKFIPIPEYDVAAMRRGMVWRPDNQNDRNTYITYPVAHAGNYKLDATENAGSHPGIDIKIPIGTPVHAYAAGIVTKVDFQSTGFGHHIVIKHPNVPDPDNPNKTTNLYSSYSHLSKTLVPVGKKIKKGEKIALSGNTGMATAPHLHFQIDKDNAPFYPYWPFTWQDVQSSPGIGSYFDAVNKKIGQSKLFAHTTHPVEYYLAHKNFVPADTRILAQAEPPKPTTIVAVDEVRTSVIAQETRTTPERSTAFAITNNQVIESRNPTVVSTRPNTTVSATQKSSVSVNGRLEIETPREFIPGKTHVVTFLADNPNLVASAGIEVSSTLKNNATITPNRLTVKDFRNGKAQVSVTTDSSFMYRLIATGNFGEVKSPSIRSQIFPDVGSSHPNQAAIKYVKDSGIFSGDGNGNFNPEEPLNRAAAVKVLLGANNVSTSRRRSAGDAQFNDVNSSDWFYDYVSEAAARNIVKGYDDGSFRGGQSVNRAEFMKMILETKGITPRALTGQPYEDVPEDSWFVDLFRFAKVQNLFPNSNYVQPGAFITRAEVAEIIYALRNVR